VRARTRKLVTLATAHHCPWRSSDAVHDPLTREWICAKSSGLIVVILFSSRSPPMVHAPRSCPSANTIDPEQCSLRQLVYARSVPNLNPIRLFLPRRGSTGPDLIASTSPRLIATRSSGTPVALMGGAGYLAETRKCNGWGSVAIQITGHELAVRGSGSPSHILLSSRMRRN